MFNRIKYNTTVKANIQTKWVLSFFIKNVFINFNTLKNLFFLIKNIFTTISRFAEIYETREKCSQVGSNLTLLPFTANVDVWNKFRLSTHSLHLPAGLQVSKGLDLPSSGIFVCRT